MLCRVHLEDNYSIMIDLSLERYWKVSMPGGTGGRRRRSLLPAATGEVGTTRCRMAPAQTHCSTSWLGREVLPGRTSGSVKCLAQDCKRGRSTEQSPDRRPSKLRLAQAECQTIGMKLLWQVTSAQCRGQSFTLA
jgi:hypothetical protein